MSRVIIRIGNAARDGMLTPAFAVDIEERKNADANHIRVRVENEHLRLRDTLREGLADMLVEKSELVYTGAKVVITINKVYGKRGESATADGKCRVEVQFKDNCPREVRDGAFKIYDNIVKSPKIAAIVAKEEKKRRTKLAKKRETCERRHGELCAPCDFSCELYRNGKCLEAKE